MGNIKSELDVVKITDQPNTVKSLKNDFLNLGIKPGMVIIIHSSLSKIGWTAGGSVSVIQALIDIITPEGTLVMPTFTGDNTDPSKWQNPPVPESWWKIIKEETPAFHPDITPTRGVGKIAETFRKWPNVIRSLHPVSSFAAWGKNTKYIIDNHELIADLGEDSPLARIYNLNGFIVLLGVSHENNTSLHLAEYRSNYSGKKYQMNGTAMIINNNRQWIEWKELNHDTEDFDQLGKDFESEINYIPKKVGLAEARLLSQQAIVDYAVEWFAKNR